MLDVAWRSFGVSPLAQRHRWWDDGRALRSILIANFAGSRPSTAT
jgi:hypothetical protein